ncbi:MAG: hypothetical protein LAP85_06540 [Acidobacteriia bacterium]|nr:hypothetical protein [Terriglobia bacterium]
MKKSGLFLIVALLVPVTLMALESGQYRLLSLAEGNKMILISQSPGKPKYILDASTAKITVDGKAAELKELSHYSIVNVKWELKKSSKDGIDLDGVASEIRVLTPEQPKKIGSD